MRYPSPTLGRLPRPISLRSPSPILAATFMHRNVNSFSRRAQSHWLPPRARSLDHRRYLAGCSTRCARPTTRAPDQRLTPSSSPHAAAEHSHCGGGVLRLLGTHAHRQQARRAPHRRGSLPRPSSRLRHRRAACTHQARPPLSRGCSLRRRPSPSGSPPPPAGSRRTPLSGASSSTLRFTCSPSREARGQTCTC